MSSQQERSISGLKAAVTRQINNCNFSISDGDISILNLKNDLIILLERYKKYELSFEAFLLCKQNSLDDESFDLLEKRHAEFEDNYNLNLRKFRHTLENLENSRSISFVNTNSNNVRVRMHEIKLSEFPGVLEEWIPFWDRFSSLIHNRTDIDNVCKMIYLVSCLTGLA